MCFGGGVPCSKTQAAPKAVPGTALLYYVTDPSADVPRGSPSPRDRRSWPDPVRPVDCVRCKPNYIMIRVPPVSQGPRRLTSDDFYAQGALIYATAQTNHTTSDIF
jgi:hypothetical protein